MGLMASEGVNSGDEAVRKGIQWLVRQQKIERCATESEPKQGCNEMGIWHQEQYTGTGFPGHFYLGYDLYRHYFPLMALGRYVQGLKKDELHLPLHQIWRPCQNLKLQLMGLKHVSVSVSSKENTHALHPAVQLTNQRKSNLMKYLMLFTEQMARPGVVIQDAFNTEFVYLDV